MGPVERWLGQIPKRVGGGDWDKPLAKQVAFVFEPGKAGLFVGQRMGYAMISERTHKARRRYRCIWCGESILPDTKYVREFSVYDGDVQKHCWHQECKDTAHKFFREEGEDEFAPWENERPLSFAEQEFQSWDCALLAQGSLILRA